MNKEIWMTMLLIEFGQKSGVKNFSASPAFIIIITAYQLRRAKK